MVTVLSGLVGGTVATIAMTAVMMATGDESPPPPAILWSKYVGGGSPADARLPGLVLHLVYGAMAGAVFVYAASLLVVAIGTLSGALLWAIVYGIGLFVVGSVFWLMIVLGQDPERQMVIMFFVLHMVYAVVLGLWVTYVPSF